MASTMWPTGKRKHQKVWWVIVRFPKSLLQGTEKDFCSSDVGSISTFIYIYIGLVSEFGSPV